MRSESLIRKIVAAFLVVAVMASLGLTAFAAEIADGSTLEEGAENMVSATIDVTESTENSGVYNVAVDYTNNSDSGVGVSMLAYAETADDGKLESSDIPNGYDENTMQIVGIDQSSQTSSGTFNFLVDTNEDATESGAIRMDKGDVGIVLLSADGAAAPTAYLFTIPADTFVITQATANPDTVTVSVGTSKDAVITELNKSIITVEGADGASEDNWTVGEWSFNPEYNGSEVGLYEATGTLVAPDAASGVNENNVTVQINVYVEAAPAVEWTATKGTLDAISVEVEEGADVTAAVQAALVDKVITVSDEADTYTAQVVVDATIAGTAALVSGDASPYTYKVTVAAGSAITSVPEGTNATIAADGFDVEFTANVTENSSGGGEEPDPETPTDAVIGDANGDGKKTGSDGTYFARHFAGWATHAKDTIANYDIVADANGDGKVTGSDGTYFARHFAGWTANAHLGPKD